MRLGLLADIHEEIELLDRAVARLRAAGVDRFLLLGDLFETGKRLEALVEHLEPLDAIGVWGNHDFGLCREVTAWVKERFSPRVLDYFARLRPRIELDGYLFQHVEPHLDPEKIEDLWGLEADEPYDPARDFAATGFRAAFLGHRHRWSAVDPEGPLDWDGRTPLLLDPGRRHVVIIHAVQQGYCACLDTTRGEVAPFRVDPDGRSNVYP